MFPLPVRADVDLVVFDARGLLGSDKISGDGVGEGFAGAGQADEPSLLFDKTLFDEGGKRGERGKPLSRDSFAGAEAQGDGFGAAVFVGEDLDVGAGVEIGLRGTHLGGGIREGFPA